MLIREVVCFAILLSFLVQSLDPVYARAVLPPPGAMLSLSPAFHPPVLKGLKVYPREPLRFDFILDPGQAEPTEAAPGSVPARSQADLKKESEKLVKYFLASLTVPEKDLWVNLSPYEKDRIIPEAFGQTEMGRDLLAQDYVLKQLTASLLYPEGETGKKFWQKVYALAQEKFGTTDIPVDTFNKVWIVPEKADVYENAQAGEVYITDARLKVMLDQDYLATELNGTLSETLSSKSTEGLSGDGAQTIVRSVLREVIIPVLEQEVNEGRNFAPLRQVYQSLVLAAWYKKKVRRSLLAAVYVDRNKTAGINIDDPAEVEKIWSRYVDTFRQGVYNLVREEFDSDSESVIPKRLFSGGMDCSQIADVVHSTGSYMKFLAINGLRISVWLKELLPGGDNSTIHLDLSDQIVEHGLQGGARLVTPYILPFDVNSGLNGTFRMDIPGEIRETEWGIQTSSLKQLAKAMKLRGNILWVLNQRRRSSDPVVIIDWGAGQGNALHDISIWLKAMQISNVRLIGYSDTFYDQWRSLPEDITMIWSMPEQLVPILEDQGVKRIDLIYSHYGMIHFKKAGQRFIEHIGQLLGLMDVKSVINNFPTGLALSGVSTTSGMALEQLNPVAGTIQSEVFRPILKEATLNASGTGGIDLDPDRIDLGMQGSGPDINFYIDSVQLGQLQSASGFVPVIVSIEPLHN